MAENDLDKGQTSGTTGTPTPETSAGQGNGNSIDAATLQTTIENLTKRLDEVDNRARTVQGEKDKTLKRTSSEVEELKRKFAEIEKLKKSGLDDDTAFDEMSFREDVRTLRQEISKLNPAQSQSAGNGEKLAVDVAKVVAEFSLDGNDAEVIREVVSKTFANETEAQLAAAKLALRRANPTPPELGGAVAIVGSAPKAKLSEQDAGAKYAEIGTLLREPSKNAAKINQLKKELNDSGYET